MVLKIKLIPQHVLNVYIAIACSLWYVACIPAAGRHETLRLVKKLSSQQGALSRVVKLP